MSASSNTRSLRLPCPGGANHLMRLAWSASDELPASARCALCGHELELRTEVLDPAGGGLRGCLACGHSELYTRKDFPPALGIAIVVLAAALVPVVPYYGSLFAAGLLDVVLYHAAPDVVVCYRCRGEHRRFGSKPRHPRFDRAIEERLRYGERAVMGSPQRPGGTADAPEPEH